MKEYNNNIQNYKMCLSIGYWGPRVRPNLILQMINYVFEFSHECKFQKGYLTKGVKIISVFAKVP